MQGSDERGNGMADIDCVIFDIGNVLIRWDPKNLYRRMGYADADTDGILAETGLLDMNVEFDLGKPFAEGIAALTARFPQHQRFLDGWNTRWTDALDGAIQPNVAVLAALKAAGVPAHAISNFSREKFDVARALFPFLDGFDELVLSADVGMVKPDRDIFDLMIDRRQLTPSRAVFIDDSAPNIRTAEAIGLRTIHFADESVAVRDRLVQLGLRL